MQSMAILSDASRTYVVHLVHDSTMDARVGLGMNGPKQRYSKIMIRAAPTSMSSTGLLKRTWSKVVVKHWIDIA